MNCIIVCRKNPTLNARSWRPNSFKASFLFAQNSSLTSLHENDIHDRRHAAYYIQRNYVWRWVGRAPADWIMNKILLAFILRLSFSILPSQVQQRAILYELNVFFSQTHSPTWALEKGWIMLCEFSFFASPRRLVVCSILRSTVHNERANCTLSPQFFFRLPQHLLPVSAVERLPCTTKTVDRARMALFSVQSVNVGWRQLMMGWRQLRERTAGAFWPSRALTLESKGTRAILAVDIPILPMFA